MQSKRLGVLVPALSCACCIALLALSAPPAAGRTWLVPLEAPTVRAGIDSAAAGDTVLVACGTYLERGIALKPGITVRSETGDPACVVIDGERLGRVFDCLNVAPGSTLEGVTITGGKTPDGWLEAMGGGVRLRSSTLHLRNCVITGNTARIGAGVGVYRSTVTIDSCLIVANGAEHYDWAAGGGMWCRESTGTINATVFEANTAFSTNIHNPGDGGGAFCNNSTLNLTDCRFTGNSTGAGAGGFYSVSQDAAILTRCTFEGNTGRYGGAMYFEYGSQAKLYDCVFTGNVAQSGGAMIIESISTPVLERCLFDSNQATLYNGGAVQCWESNPVFRGCVFRGNSAANEGGALHLGGAVPIIQDCLMTGNSAGTFGGAIRLHYTAAQIEGCTLAGNAAPLAAGIYSGPTSSADITRTIIAFSTQGEAAFAAADSTLLFTCSDLYGNAGGDWTGDFAAQLGLDGNISADPQFCGADRGDFHVAVESPCAPDGSGGCGLIGALAPACGLTGAPDTPAPRPLLAARNLPNPFNARTTIHFELPAAAHARLSIYSLDGRLVRRLVDAPLPAGAHQAVWDGRDAAGAEAATGSYLCRLEAGSAATTRKMSLIK